MTSTDRANLLTCRPLPIAYSGERERRNDAISQKTCFLLQLTCIENVFLKDTRDNDLEAVPEGILFLTRVACDTRITKPGNSTSGEKVLGILRWGFSEGAIVLHPPKKHR